MTTPHHPEVAEVWSRVESVMSLVDEHVDRVNADSFVATHQTGTVEATVDGRLRLTGLNIDPRLLNLGAQEVASRINETVSAAIDYAANSVEHDVTEMTARVAHVLAELRDVPPPG
jgi:DNA-binding protein YbaB